MRLIFYILISSIALPSSADLLSVEYASFYNHLRKIEGDDVPSLQFAFGFMHIESGNLCKINEINIVTPKVTIPVDVSPEQRFTLPSEKALKQAHAMVEVDLFEQANQCDMSVQLETKSEHLQSGYSNLELSNIFKQYQTFFAQMGGFLSFLMPNVNGLRIYFSEDVVVTPPIGLTVIDNQIVISETWLDKGENLPLATAPYRITAVID